MLCGYGAGKRRSSEMIGCCGKATRSSRGDAGAFNVDVKGLQKLTLRITGKDSINGAWGAWGEPVLKRKLK